MLFFSHDEGATLVFKNVCVTLNKQDILKNVSGLAKVGHMLAIMGPSGKCRNSSPYLYKANGASCLIMSSTPVSQEDIGEDLFLFYTSY